MPQSKDSSSQLLVIAAALVAIIAISYFLLNTLNSGESVVETSNPTISSSPSSANGSISGQDETISIDTTLQLASMALASGNLIEPPNANALHFYQQILRQAPDNQDALLGLAELGNSIASQANTALAANDLAGAATAITTLNRFAAGTNDVIALEEQFAAATERNFGLIERTLAGGNFAQATLLANSLGSIPGIDPVRVENLVAQITAAQQAAVQRRAAAAASQASTNTDPVASPADSVDSANADDATTSAEVSDSGQNVDDPLNEENVLNQFLSSAQSRITSNQLFSPANDNALYYFQQALIVDAANETALGGIQGLIATTRTNALTFARNSDWDAADNTLAPLATLESAQDTIELTRNEIRALRIEQARTQVVRLREFEPERIVQPDYPRRARQRDIEGSVKLRFLITETGATDSIEVVESSSRLSSQFSRAAVSAVRQWRFKPRLLDDEPIAQLTETTIEFSLGN